MTYDLHRGRPRIHNMLNHIGDMFDHISTWVYTAATRFGPDNQHLTAEQVKPLIMEHCRQSPSKSFYPSDISEQYGLDFEAVHTAVECLKREGKLKEGEA